MIMSITPLEEVEENQFKYYSKDGSSITLGGTVDNFTVGYKTSIDCSN